MEALDAAEHEPEATPDTTPLAASTALFKTPRTGMTARVDSTDRRLLDQGLRGFRTDEPVIELDETPHPKRSWFLLVAGALGLVGSGWGVHRAKKAKAREEAQLARWQAAGHAAPHNNPFTV